MYVLENTGKTSPLICCQLIAVLMIFVTLRNLIFSNVTGEFVNHYELRMGDSVTFYEDELKNLVSFTFLLHNLVISKLGMNNDNWLKNEFVKFV